MPKYVVVVASDAVLIYVVDVCVKLCHNMCGHQLMLIYIMGLLNVFAKVVVFPLFVFGTSLAGCQ
jgi:hypothetical protein